MKIFYYLVVLILFILQAFFTFNSLDQVRSEDVHTSIREVFWWQNREIFQAQNSNIGWYSTLSILYSLLGFDINMGRFYRLGLSLISLFCLAGLLKKYLGEKVALVPLLTMGLSPTLLFFNTLSVPYGIDLQYLPIVLYLLTSSIKLIRPLGWLLSMFAWLSFPTFVFYLPALLVVYLSHLSKLRYLLISILAFLVPFILGLIWVKDPLRMIYDPNINRGLLTAGGGFILSGDNFIKTIAASFENLFIRPTSYYLEVSLVEFSHVLPLFSFIFVLWASFLLLKKGKLKRVVFLAFLVMIFNLITIGFTIDGGIPGGRRNTPVLAAFYVLFSLVWYSILTGKLKLPFKKELALGVLFIILVHHILAYPFNLTNFKNPSPYHESTWFSGNARQNLTKMIDDLQKQDLYLDCSEFQKRGIYECGYSNIYAALSGSCIWNKLSCHDVYANLPGMGVTKLSIKLFQDYNLEKE